MYGNCALFPKEPQAIVAQEIAEEDSIIIWI